MEGTMYTHVHAKSSLNLSHLFAEEIEKGETESLGTSPKVGLAQQSWRT
jgi:siderophore synthetase component